MLGFRVYGLGFRV